MAFEEFWAAQCTEVELLAFCKKIQDEIKLETQLVKEIKIIGSEYDQLYEEYCEMHDIVDSTVYDASLIEAMAGDCSGFAAVAERAVKKEGLNRADGKLNNYVIALREMGYPNINCFMYVQLVKNKRYAEAESYLNMAMEQKEQLAEFFYGCELLRKNKRRKGLKWIQKVAADATHPLNNKARAIIIIYKPLSAGLKALAALLLTGSVLSIPMMAAWGPIGMMGTMVALVCIVLLGFVAPWADRKYKYSRQKNFMTFDGVILENADEAFGVAVDCPEFPTTELSNSKVEYIVDYANANTGYYSQNVSGLSGLVVENARSIVRQIHEIRLDRKQYYMEKCKKGDAAAKMALLVFFDTEYKDGDFVTNKQANPCQFMPKTMAKIVD